MDPGPVGIHAITMSDPGDHDGRNAQFGYVDLVRMREEPMPDPSDLLLIKSALEVLNEAEKANTKMGAGGAVVGGAGGVLLVGSIPVVGQIPGAKGLGAKGGSHVGRVVGDSASEELGQPEILYSDLYEARFEGLDPQQVDLRGAALHDADHSGRDFRTTDLRGADLSRTNLTGADFSGANLSGAKLVTADLSDADLRNADLSGANLRASDLSGADLRNADLRGADLHGASFGDADLTGADFSGADVRGTDLDEDVRSIVRYDQHTRWPAYFE